MSSVNFYYCFIKYKYLITIFDHKTIVKRKYHIRPFLFIPELNMAIAIPQITNNKDKEYCMNFYFKDKKHYLDVENYIFVPECMVKYKQAWVNKNINSEYLIELQVGLKDIFKIIGRINGLMRNNVKFKNKHKYLLISLKQYKKFNKHSK